MFTREQLEEHITSMRSQLNENDSALLSEGFLSILSNYALALEEISNLNEEVTNLKNTNDELLKTNGRLFQQVGIQSKQAEEENPIQEIVEELTLEEVINEKGDLI